ncbi:1-deoxy-D-xylulose-5-phosphate reductoisomerase [Nisaea acidiphila]|uniref:1-deoxy-D-xylulose 5-phosphate reductoisomerase n=1 Tax=Nisaea acidiphila TaxID=1862145 RepID=A0A9J7ASQ3_9PROT|nr:1-deoxy-D-xylulose-5-phosphate reductoisomerase [Nisaea acidiphila]UUX50368.1 1-deoxy-D-xylulose-5-phosphate reductoisomerase [Nisaea acidiphila]
MQDTERKTVSILGATGSVGGSTADLLLANPERFAVDALTGGRNVARLVELASALHPRFVAIADPSCYGTLKDALSGSGIEVAAGDEAVCEAADRPADWVMAAIVGCAGLLPTLTAVRRGATVALANKECLVSAGDIMMREVADAGATLLPVDSEHNAIFQVFEQRRREAIDKIVLTASGGPFRDASLAEMAGKSPAEAVAHPRWDMGAKISVDSATMMNKGLEVIEAAHLFDLPEERIDVLVHPESIVHSMVAYRDGSVLAQLGMPDMRTPISYALAWPERMETNVRPLDLTEIATLTFSAPDETRFPALALAREALRLRGAMPAILNAANEIAVAGFLEGRLEFTGIAELVGEVMAAADFAGPATIDDVIGLDREVRVLAQDRLVGQLAHSAARADVESTIEIGAGRL